MIENHEDNPVVVILANLYATVLKARIHGPGTTSVAAGGAQDFGRIFLLLIMCSSDRN